MLMYVFFIVIMFYKNLFKAFMYVLNGNQYRLLKLWDVGIMLICQANLTIKKTNYL